MKSEEYCRCGRKLTNYDLCPKCGYASWLCNCKEVIE